MPEVVVGKNRIFYSEVDPGGTGTIIGTGAQPSSAPTATPASGTGLSAGVRTYKITFTSAAGESLPSPPASVTTGEAVPPPSSAPSRVLQPGFGLFGGGQYKYSVTFVTSLGETTGGPETAPITPQDPIADPTTALVWTGTTGGSLVAGQTYRWKYTFRHADGRETAPSPFTEVTMPPLQTAVIFASVTPPSGWSVRLYRTIAGPGATYLHATNATFGSDIRDGTADGSLGSAAPAANDTVRLQVLLSAIPIGPSGVTSRKIYRTEINGSQLKLLTTLNNNTSTTFLDAIADASLGANIPTSSGTVTGQVQLTNIPIGGAAVTSRKIYRTAAGSATLKLLTTIADNVTTTHIDALADASLGAGEPPLLDSSGLTQPSGQVLAGATTIPVAGVSWANPNGGWAIVGNGEQVVHYDGISGNTLTGVTGLTSSISYNSSITAAPTLRGIPASGPGSVTHIIPKGEEVNRLITVDSAAGQAALAEALGAPSTGVIEEFVQDRRLTAEEATARAEAILRLREFEATELRYQTRHPRTKAGRIVTVMLPTPTNVEGQFRIQRVVISDFHPNLHPLFQVDASNSRFSFEDLLRGIRAGKAQR